MSKWVYLCRTDEVSEGRGMVVEADGTRLAVIRSGDSYSVLFDRCPHAGGSLGSGWVEEGAIVCPLHRWSFRLRDGRCLDVPGNSAHVIESRVASGQVFARL